MGSSHSRMDRFTIMGAIFKCGENYSNTMTNNIQEARDNVFKAIELYSKAKAEAELPKSLAEQTRDALLAFSIHERDIEVVDGNTVRISNRMSWRFTQDQLYHLPQWEIKVTKQGIEIKTRA